MSSPPPLILAPEASDDFSDTLQYTLETWGEAQVAIYSAILDKTLLTIQQHPHLGLARPELGADFRSLSAGEHVIVYEIRTDALYIHRILHNRMDISKLV